MYQGLMFSADVNSQPLHTRASLILKLTEEFLTNLSQRYYRLSFGFHYSHADLRAIQWFNYHEPHKGHFKFTLQYTGLIDLDQFTDIEDYLHIMRIKRRTDCQKTLRDKIEVEA